MSDSRHPTGDGIGCLVLILLIAFLSASWRACGDERTAPEVFGEDVREFVDDFNRGYNREGP